MTQTIKLQRGWNLDGEQLGGPGNKEESIAVEQIVTLDVAVADGVTDGLHALTLDVSQMKAFYLESDQDVTLETNDGAAPDNTITLTADTPEIWSSNDTASNPFTADVTALYITNASGATANIKLRFGVDPTV